MAIICQILKYLIVDVKAETIHDRAAVTAARTSLTIHLIVFETIHFIASWTSQLFQCSNISWKSITSPYLLNFRVQYLWWQALWRSAHLRWPLTMDLDPSLDKYVLLGYQRPSLARNCDFLCTYLLIYSNSFMLKMWALIIYRRCLIITL